MIPTLQTNASATEAAFNLTRAVAKQERSMARLSSGSRLVETSDDAAGTAVHIKTGAAVRRIAATEANLSNALSMMQTQAASLNAISQQLSRMSELVVLMQDATKTTDDLDNYMTEFDHLRLEMGRTFEDQFNGVDLFFYQGVNTAKTVYLDEDGMQSMSLNRTDFTINSGWSSLLGPTRPYSGTVSVTDTPANLVDETVWGSSSFQLLIEDLATRIAENGATQSRLGSALDALRIKRVNLEQAASRIADTDVASESAALARSNILVQSGASMVSQANASANTLLKLIQG